MGLWVHGCIDRTNAGLPDRFLGPDWRRRVSHRASKRPPRRCVRTDGRALKLSPLPLIGPGLANAFLLGFIVIMADFVNPLVLGGNLDVLSTEIFFAIVGAQYDQSGAAILATILLGFTLLAFYFQRFWLGKKATSP